MGRYLPILARSLKGPKPYDLGCKKNKYIIFFLVFIKFLIKDFYSCERICYEESLCGDQCQYNSKHDFNKNLQPC